VFDAKGKTFRDDWYPEYKAQRAHARAAGAADRTPIHEVVKLLGWPVLTVPGIEADDAIGTLWPAWRPGRSPGDRLDRRQGPGPARQRRRCR
jgi:5'-3' exonuclease